MKNILIIFLTFIATTSGFSQSKYFTRAGHISFHSDAALEKIEAHNYQVTSMLETGKGELIMAILIKSFEFEKALMQEHFNENYLESDKYPKASFTGYIQDLNKLDLSEEGLYQVIVEGNLSLHGVTKKIKSAGTLEVKGDHLHARATFPLVLQDYKIKIPSISKDKISETIQVKIAMNYDLYKK